MFEIWWKDRLIDLVPSVRELPDGLEVRARHVVREPIEEPPPDWRFPKVLAMCLLLFLACVMVMTLTPLADGSLDDGIFQQRVVRALVLPPEPPKKLVALTGKKVEQLFSGKTTGNRKVSVATLMSIWDTGLSRLGGGSGNAIDAALDHLGAGPIGDSGGIGGPRGNGPGMGPGFGIGAPGARFGKPVGTGLGPKKDQGPGEGPLRISDGLPKDLVAKVIRAHLNEIKFCYERELQRDTGLAGKVTVAFTIGPTGEVIEAAVAESTLENANVEECMLSRVRRWRFPEPAAGGTVDVTHPWIFRGAGDNDP